MIDRLVRAAPALLTLVALAVLSGCATTGSSSPSLFVLDDGPSAPDNRPAPGAPTLVVTPVAIAAYLDQGGLVYQTGPHKILIANDNRWASSLSGQLTDALYDVLTTNLPDVNVERTTGARDDAYRLRTHIDRFLGQSDGNALVAGRWTLVAPSGAIVASQSFERKTPLLRDGYPALVSSLSRGWRQVGQSAASKMAAALQQDTRPDPDRAG